MAGPLNITQVNRRNRLVQEVSPRFALGALWRMVVCLLGSFVHNAVAAEMPRYYGHATVADEHGVIAPWYTGLNGQCDFRVRIAAETLKRYPWKAGPDGVALPDYINNGRWSIAVDGTITPGKLTDWGNGLGLAAFAPIQAE